MYQFQSNVGSLFITNRHCFANSLHPIPAAAPGCMCAGHYNDENVADDDDKDESHAAAL